MARSAGRPRTHSINPSHITSGANSMRQPAVAMTRPRVAMAAPTPMPQPGPVGGPDGVDNDADDYPAMNRGGRVKARPAGRRMASGGRVKGKC
jgi:hypothetical protein